jgi:ethanolamine ammonia-lyase small subunit
MVDRSAIEALVRATLSKRGEAPAHAAPADAVLLHPSAPQSPHNPAELQGLIKATPARIAVGRAGTRYTTATLLRLRSDHAAAKDAVMSEVDAGLLARLGILAVRSQATDKRHFLQRPDAGRALSPEARAEIERRRGQGTAGTQLQIVYGDGLSAMAINTHLTALHQALVAELDRRGIRHAPPIFIHLSRVKIMDEVAQLTGAEACLFICGERPGLGFADSLSAYYIYRPQSGATDADREVISNINPRGLAPQQAAVSIAEAIARILRDKKSGVVLG